MTEESRMFAALERIAPSLSRRALLGTAVATAPLAPAFGQSLLGGSQAPAAPAPQPAPAAPSLAPVNAPPAAAGSEILVDRARAAPIPIAIVPFDGTTPAADIGGVITGDLGHCGLFRPIDPAAFVGKVSPDAVPNFDNWKAIGAAGLVTGRIVPDAGGKLRVEFRLWDVVRGQQIQGTAYSTPASNWRRIGHIIADVIYERMLGEKGYFDTRVAYISITGPRGRAVKRLAIMDQDGENNRLLTDGSFLVLTPRFHPTQDLIAFMSYVNNRPRVYLFNLDTGAQRLVGNFPGMTLSPRFSPDGGSLLLAETRGSGSSIFLIGLDGGGTRQLTQGGSIDVSPCFSPDGTQIVFNSDRGANQQLYVMNADGSNVRRISFGKGQYGAPVWSPRGDVIAFIRFGNPEAPFELGVMRPDGSGERILSQSWYCDGPTFCPNGRVIMFWKELQSGSQFSQLWSVDITGFNERVALTPTSASDPAWSPLLP
jgi:TolB protein